MTSKSLFLTLLCTLLLITALNSQNCTYSFSGIVEDFHDKSPITGATIFIKNLNKYTATDLNGQFNIDDICKGKLIVEISHLGCETVTLELDINNDLYKIIDLEHHLEELNEISVKASTGLKTKTAQETLLTKRQLDNYSDASLGDALKEISGVSSINSGNSIVKPIINGLHSSRILTSVNGVRLQDQEWGIEHAPNVDINTAGSISVIKGANALEYGGDAIGGVIIINPAKIIVKDTLYGKTILSQQTNGRLSSFATSIYKSFKKGWFVNGQGSIKRAGDFEAANYMLTNTGLDTKGFSINTGFKNFNNGFEVYYSHLSNKVGILSASHIGSNFDLVRAINRGIPSITEDFSYDINAPKQEVTHQLLKVSSYNRLKGLGKLSLQYDFQNNNRLEFDRRKGDLKSTPATDLTLKTHTLNADIKLDANHKKVYKIGVSAGYQNNFPDPRTKVRRLIPDYDKYMLGSYAIADYKFDKVNIDLGVRYDFNHINALKYYITTRWDALNYNDDFDHIIISKPEGTNQYLTNPKFTFHNVSFSAGLLYKFNTNNSLQFNYGLSNRPPNPSELFSDGLHHSAARIEIGDIRITPETSNRVSATYKYNTSKLTATIEGFYNHIKDFIYLEPSGDNEKTTRGDFTVWGYKQVNANLFGVDTNISYQLLDHLTLQNKSSLLKGYDLSGHRPLIDTPPFRSNSSIFFQQKKWHNFYITLESDYNARQNEYPNNNYTTYIPTTGQNELVDISTPPSAYHLYNVASGFDFKLSQTTININLIANNIFNKSYRNYLSRLRFFSDDIGRNFKLQLTINY